MKLESLYKVPYYYCIALKTVLNLNNKYVYKI